MKLRALFVCVVVTCEFAVTSYRFRGRRHLKPFVCHHICQSQEQS